MNFLFIAFVEHLQKTNFEFVSFYSTKTTKQIDANKKLAKEGQEMDKSFTELKSGNLVRRVLFGETKSDDWKNVDFKNPEVLGKYVNRFAKEGGRELVKNLIKPSPVVVTVTGAAGQIAYSLLFRIANGDMLGADQPVILKLLERPEAMNALSGVVMELQDGAFPLLSNIITTDSVDEAFRDCDYAMLVGAKPRGPGMERGDLLKENAKIFAEQGKALNKYANADVLTCVVGNPANTNCLITAMNAKDIPKENFSAMTRLDHDRGLALIAQKFNARVDEIDRFAVWGNHSATMFPDVNHTRVRGVWLRNLLKGQNEQTEDWIYKEFVPKVQQRGAAIINARGKSSAASAADAAIKHMRDWVHGSDQWLSMAVYSDGIYGTPMGIYCSYPVKCFGAGEYGIVDGLPIDAESAKRINASCLELVQEKQAIEQLLPNSEYRFYTMDKSKVYSPEFFLPYAKQQEQLKKALSQQTQQ